MRRITMTKFSAPLKKFHHRVFWCGAITYAGLYMAYQDWMGKEAYLALVNTQWVDLHWMVGLTIAGVAIWYSGKMPADVPEEEEDE